MKSRDRQLRTILNLFLNSQFDDTILEEQRAEIEKEHAVLEVEYNRLKTQLSSSPMSIRL